MATPFPHAGELAALGTAICWTVTSMAFESAGRRIGSLAVNLIRLGMAIVLLTAFNWLLRGHPLPDDASQFNWVWLSLSGLVGFTVGDLCLFRAFVVVGARVSMLLMAMVPPITALFGWLVMGEVLSPRDLAGMVLTVAGVAWVVSERRRSADGQTSRHPVGGVLLGLGGAGGQALGLVLSKYGMAGYDPFAATQIRVFAGTAGFALLFVVIGWWPRVWSALTNSAAMARTAVGAFFGPFLGVSLSLVAVTYTQAGVAATLMALVPVMIIAPAVLVRHEHVSLRAVLGSVIAVAGSALLFL